MFWKSTAWSWDEAAGHDDDDGGYLLAADLRRTPDSAPDTDLNLRTNQSTSSSTTTGLGDFMNPGLTTSRPLSFSPTEPGLGDFMDPGLTTSRPLSFGPTEPGLCDFVDPGLTTEPNYSSYISTLHTSTNQRPAAQHSSRKQEVTVSIVRGKDGFGFTICSDCPVRVQAVDPGGPAQQADLHQGDSILQLNGLPVETWKCVDLAHTIRSCPSQIVLVVWRGLPEIRSGCDALLRPQTQATGRKLLPHPAHSKHGRHRRGQGSGVRSSLGALGSLWRDRKEEDQNLENLEDQNLEDCRPPTTLKGTRVTSSNGDNYIILSPVDPGGQLLQPVYHDRNGTIGRLYQTHPSRGQNLLHDSRPASSRQLFTSHASTLTPAPPSTSTSPSPPGNYGNYQNCTIVQSHLPCSGYGTYVTLAPKTLIFPVFVQPLDLCSPDRTLLLSEEMILHQADLLPAKVTVLIYTDLLLLTREDEAGHCNVLQSPLYLNTLQLREVAVEPLHLYLLQNSHSCCRCLFSLEAFSMEQKLRVSLCLHDNIQQQLVATETGHSQQLSDLPSDFGLLSLRQSDLLYRTSSPYSSLCDSLRPPSPSTYSPSSPFSSSPAPPPFSSLPSNTSSSPPARTFTSVSSQRSWKERGGREEEEERQQGEGESASETSESIGGRGLLLSPAPSIMKEEESDEEEEEEDGGGVFSSSFRVAGSLRRSLSEGSLLQEARSSRFLSDSTIHRLTRPPSFHPHTGPAPRPPSPHTLRKQLTGEGGEGGEGGSLHHMLLLLHGPKNSESRNLQLKKKTKILAEDVRSRLPFLQRRKNSSCFHGNSLEKALRNNRPGAAEVQRWAESLEALLTNQYGVAVFRHFLRSEFSEENLDFWLAVERFRRTRPLGKMAARAAKIYDEFISTTAARQVNVDSSVRELTNHSLRLCVSPASFQRAQQQVFGLMETDSYPRFLKSRLYAQLANQSSAPGSANQSAAAQQLANQNM